MGELNPQMAINPATAPKPADGGFSSRNLLALGTVLGAGAFSLIGGGPSAEASVDYQCNNILAPGYNTIVCHIPKQEAVQFCEKQTVASEGVFPVYDFKDEYSSATGSEIGRVAFGLADVHGCDPVGLRRTTVQMQIRDGATGGFENTGKPFSVATNNPGNFKETLKGPIDCATDLPGSAVRSAVTVSFKVRPQFLEGAKPKHVVDDTAPQAIC